MLGHGVQEESLASGLGRRIDEFRDVQQQMANFADDLSRLKESCEKLKTQRTQLMGECRQKELDLSSLTAEIGRVTRERDALQDEFAGLVDEAHFFRAADAAASVELEASGRVARRLWVQTEKVRDLEKKLAAAEEERGVLGELKRRIAELERENEEKEGIERKERETSAGNEELRYEVAVLKDELEKIRRENADLRDSARAEGKNRAAAERDAEKLRDSLQLAHEEVRHFKALAADRDELEKKHKAAERAKSQGSPRALQRMPSNVPITPTKTPAVPSPFHSPPQASSTPSNIAKNYEYLQNRHRALKAQFDAMRAKYAKDIQHWKEFRAIQVARQEIRQKRREERKATESTPSAPSTESVRPEGPEPNRKEGSGPAATEATTAAPAVQRQQSPTSVTRQHSSPDIPTPSPPERQLAATVSAPAPPSQSRAVELSSTKAVSTPTRAPPPPPPRDAVSAPSRTPRPTDSRVLSRQPTHVSPWLGGSRKPAPSAPPKRARASSFSDEEEPPSKRAGVRPTLVRDRGSMSTTSLRKSALQRSIHDTNDGNQATPARKRDLDLEALSPAERAAERKRVAALPPAERRELYAGYKAGGRYVPPQEVERTVTDEFEIDPARNGGVGHRYHAVVRARDERRRMHGGGCECCSDYYEAIGPLPRFNPGPVWRDDPEEDEQDKEFHALQDHRNRVSRHREEHPRNPTPPEFWAIGFPTTQQVAEQNAVADEMHRKREAALRREVAHKHSKWKKK